MIPLYFIDGSVPKDEREAKRMLLCSENGWYSVLNSIAYQSSSYSASHYIDVLFNNDWIYEGWKMYIPGVRSSPPLIYKKLETLLL